MNLLRRLLPGIALVMGAFLFSIGLQTLAFTEPSAGPTGGTVYAPLNTSPTAQTKNGNLTIGGQITITGGTPGAGKVLTSNASGLASWVTPSAGGVSQIIAGTNVTISPVGGTGAVTINASGGGGTGTVTSVGTNNGLTGGTITTSGTLGLNLTGISTCTNPTTNKIYWNGSYLACGTDQTGGAGGLSGSGSTNYVSKWTGGTSLGNSQIYDNGTNVGIGTAAPSAKLQVVGNGLFNNISVGGAYPGSSASWGYETIGLPANNNLRINFGNYEKFLFGGTGGNNSNQLQFYERDIRTNNNQDFYLNWSNTSGNMVIGGEGENKVLYMAGGSGATGSGSYIDTADYYIRSQNRWVTQMIDFSAAGSVTYVTPTATRQAAFPAGLSGSPRAAMLNFTNPDASCNDTVIELYKSGGGPSLGYILGRVNNGELDVKGDFTIVPLVGNQFDYKIINGGSCSITVRTIGFIY